MHSRYVWVIFVALFFISSSFKKDNRLCLAQLPLEGSIVLDNSYTPESLIKDVLTKGVCDNVSNINSIGDNNGIGYFSNGSDIFDIEDGIIISTGYTTNALGPNTHIDRSSNFHDNNGDSDLAQLATGTVKDVVGIEFDFIPLDSFIEFTYIFASEEYCEFVGSAFNDVFGFFISGPGINGPFSNNGKNVAFVPGTNQYVSVNTINRSHNSNYFISNLNQAGAERCGIPYIDQPNVNRIEYDGFTTPLSALLKLSPCEIYHIKMVIGDVKDNFYDSAVFLKAGSFNLGGQVRVSTDAVVDGEILQEGCDNAYFVFEREEGTASNFPLQVNFKINEESTAEEGVDFSELPSSITIPAGETMATLPVHALNDNETEGIESIILELNIPCACYSDTTFLFIVDAPPFFVTVEDAVVCESGAKTITPMLEGGSPPYTYLWSTGETSSSINISPSQGNSFSVTVTDDCGQVNADDFLITTRPAPFATLSGNIQICEGETGYLTAEFTGVPPWELHYSLNGELQPPLTNLQVSPFFLPVTQEGQYEITNFYDNDCSGYISGIGVVDVWDIIVDVDATPPDCFESLNGEITLDVTGDNPPFEITWAHSGTSDFSLSELPAGTYLGTITDQQHCSKVIEIPLLPPSSLKGIFPTCDCLKQGISCLQAKGGTPPYLYSIDGLSFMDESLFTQLTTGESYQLTVEDANGCRIEQTFQMPFLNDRFFTLSEKEDVKIGEPFTINPNIILPNSLIDSISWQPSTFLDCTNCAQPSLIIERGITYTLTILDVFGCSQKANVRLNIDPSIDVFVPNAFSPNGDQINDLLTIYANDFQVEEVLSFQIFDRWGGHLYQANNFAPNNPRIGWDGTARGHQLQAGIYTYYLKVRLNDGRTYEIGGDVLLIR